MLNATDDLPKSQDARLVITWIGHSTFLIQSNGVNVLTDPIWSNRASPLQFAGPRRYAPPAIRFETLPRIDVVFISHDHYDHLDAGTVELIAQTFPAVKWAAPLGVGDFLKQRGATNVAVRDWWEACDLGRISAFSTPAQHFSGRYPWKRNTTLWCGWIIELGGHRVYFAGDTALHPEFKEIARRSGPIDAAILPIGAYEPRWFMQPVHMDPEEAVLAYQALTGNNAVSSKCVFVPSHWGTFRLTDEPLDEPPRRLRAAWRAAKLPENQLRVLQLGERFEQV
ncbi:MAG: MBL fold metallo-hydrolase [Gemmatimonadaceae bacterium]